MSARLAFLGKPRGQHSLSALLICSVFVQMVRYNRAFDSVISNRGGGRTLGLEEYDNDKYSSLNVIHLVLYLPPYF